MKTISIQVSDEEHKEIKLAATHAGVSIKDFLLSNKRQLVSETAERVVEAMDKVQGTPKTGLESLAKDQFHGPLFRNKKQGKI
jgi:uncharacterized protein (DUF1778 family)